MITMLDRWQFAVTTVYHFLFVPVSIGLALLVAVMQTLAYRRKDEEWDALARFFGKLFVINFALGIATGIVQEFQFGMNWSNYSVFVGNIFGAPLAIEGLLAFFMESTFLGLWLFGRGRLSARLHLATIWLVSIGTILSALFILAANAWMQHPVGYKVVGNRAELTDFWALLANSTLWAEFSHTFLAAITTGGMVVLGVSAWKLLRRHETAAFARAARLAAAVSLVAVIGVMVTGDLQARLMDEQQPMKMAAAEALYDTQSGASFSILTVGNLSGNPIFQVRVPHLLSLIADMSWNGSVSGIHQIQAHEAATYGPASYVPVIWLSYWSFRLMIGFGVVILAVAIWALVLARRKRLDRSRWFLWASLLAIGAPFLANTFGWIFTEAGRQPWVVNGLMRTDQAISPTVGAGSVALTLAGFTVLYTVLGVIEVMLMSRYARHPLHEDEADSSGSASTPALVY
ncbi:MAG: cytochrome ubiquinol oxidase subunit I [Actinomycetota bacterium]|jgi:cytochrome d ubiquinol oxidase subunit I|nr:cytochrome ubiquinol oxidase subunit I [Actinomycetota bacterium]